MRVVIVICMVLPAMRQSNRTVSRVLLICLLLQQTIAYQVDESTYEAIDPTRSGHRVVATLYLAKDNSVATPVVAFAHGFGLGSTAYPLARELAARLGMIVLLPHNLGVPSTLGLALDQRFLLAHAVEESRNPASQLYKRVANLTVLAGHSLGGGSTLLAADSSLASAYPPPTAIVTVSLGTYTIPDALLSAPKISGQIPALLMTASEDCVDPPLKNSLLVFNQMKSRCAFVVSVVGGSHCQYAARSYGCSLTEKLCGARPNISREAQTEAALHVMIPFLHAALEYGSNGTWANFDASLAHSVIKGNVSLLAQRSESCGLSDAFKHRPALQDVRKLQSDDFSLLRDWTMTYEGILRKEVKIGPELEERSLLVIHDIADGLTMKRMLDIKLGKETAVANFQGKSAFAAFRQHQTVDRFTNSSEQGFRLEGFDNPPSCLDTQDYGGRGMCAPCGASAMTKKYKRLSYQRQSAREFMRYFGDCSDMIDLERTDTLCAIEYSEALLFDAARQLGTMCADSLKMPIPQMWIGSSLCLACDAGRLPKRQSALQRLSSPRPKGSAMQPADIAKVCVFDWGRSELNTQALHDGMTEEEQAEHYKYWALWQRPLFRCLFEVTNLYLSQFLVLPDNAKGRMVITISVWDYDTYDPSDYLGSAELPLAPTEEDEEEEEMEVEIFDGWGNSRGFVYVTVAQQQPPQGSRLQEMWSVEVHRVEGLPKSDIFSDTDPLVRVDIGSPRDDDCESWNLVGMRASAQTPVFYDDRNAEIGHTLLFGIVTPSYANQLISWINGALKSNLSVTDFETIPDASGADRGRAYEEFLVKVNGAAHLSRDSSEVYTDVHNEHDRD